MLLVVGYLSFAACCSCVFVWALCGLLLVGVCLFLVWCLFGYCLFVVGLLLYVVCWLLFAACC